MGKDLRGKEMAVVKMCLGESLEISHAELSAPNQGHSCSGSEPSFFITSYNFYLVGYLHHSHVRCKDTEGIAKSRVV